MTISPPHGSKPQSAGTGASCGAGSGQSETCAAPLGRDRRNAHRWSLLLARAE